MRLKIMNPIVTAALVLSFIAIAARPLAMAEAQDAPAAPPAPAAAAPATQPAGFTITGQVNTTPSLDFPDGHLSRVVVFLASNPVLDAAPLPHETATVAQHNKAFVPNFLIIPRNTQVEFPNWDHFSHNVFSRSAAAPAFDLNRYPYGQSKTRKFDKAGVVQVFCNIHPTMKALIYVTPNPYFARADADGKFEIKGVPPGTYEVTAWQERCATQSQTVEVKAGALPEVTITLEEDRNGILANDPPRHGQAYGVDRGLGVKRERLNLPVVRDSHPAPTTAPCDDCP